MLWIGGRITPLRSSSWFSSASLIDLIVPFPVVGYLLKRPALLAQTGIHFARKHST
jgi:hypothetical protein